jgi:hypothetical protein
MRLPDIFKAQTYSPSHKVSQAIKFSMGVGLTVVAQHWSQRPLFTACGVAGGVFAIQLYDRHTDLKVLGLKYRGFNPILRGALTAAMISSGLIAFTAFCELNEAWNRSWKGAMGASLLNAVVLYGLTKQSDVKKFLTNASKNP